MSEKIDVLNRDEFIANVKKVIDTISDHKQGCCFVINGIWGSDKSFVLERLEKQLKDWQYEETEKETRLLPEEVQNGIDLVNVTEEVF